jgi:ribokinase
MSKRLVVVGSIHMDLVLSAPRLPRAGDRIVANEFHTCPGGKGANQAFAAARLGADVDLVGCVGDDGWGSDLRSALVEEGVDVQHVITRAGVPTGVGVITVLPQGDITVIVAPGADRTLEVGDIERARDVIENAALLVMQLEVPIPTLSHAAAIARAKGVPLLLNASPAQPLPTELLAGVDVLVVDQSDAMKLLPEKEECSPAGLARRLGALGPKLVVVTRGGRRALLFDGEQIIEHDGFEVDIVDSTGARDAFVGALALGRLHGHRLEETLRSACAAGALASTRWGALPSLPTHEAHEEFLRKPATA